jgi:hypothetical protein
MASYSPEMLARLMLPLMAVEAVERAAELLPQGPRGRAKKFVD